MLGPKCVHYSEVPLCVFSVENPTLCLQGSPSWLAGVHSRREALRNSGPAHGERIPAACQPLSLHPGSCRGWTLHQTRSPTASALVLRCRSVDELLQPLDQTGLTPLQEGGREGGEGGREREREGGREGEREREREREGGRKGGREREGGGGEKQHMNFHFPALKHNGRYRAVAVSNLFTRLLFSRDFPPH